MASDIDRQLSRIGANGLPTTTTCCLIENGKRCTKPAGSHCFSKRMQKTVRQKRLKITISTDADQTLICQVHRQQLILQGKNEAAARRRPASATATPTQDTGRDSDDELSSNNRRRKISSTIRFDQLSANALRRYKKFFKLQTRQGLNKTQLADVVADHFRTIPVVDEKEILTYFVYAVKTKKNKLDQIKPNGNYSSDN